MNGVTVAEARRDLAGRHGFSSWAALLRARRRRWRVARRHRRRSCSPTARSRRATSRGVAELVDAHPELVEMRGTNGNDLFGMANDIEITRLLLERGADVNRGNDYGWTKLHQAGYGNDVELARLLLDAGARTDLSARGDGGTPLIAALFWGHREVVRAARARAGQPPCRGRARTGRDDRRARRHAGGRRPPRLLPAARRLPRVDAVRRPAGDPRRGARLGGEGRPRRGDRPAGRARRASRGRPVPRHAAHLGGGERAHRVDPAAGRARRGRQRGRHLRRSDRTARASRRSISPPRQARRRRSSCCSSSERTRRSGTGSTTATRRAGRRTAAGPIWPSGLVHREP